MCNEKEKRKEEGKEEREKERKREREKERKKQKEVVRMREAPTLPRTRNHNRRNSSSRKGPTSIALTHMSCLHSCGPCFSIAGAKMHHVFCAKFSLRGPSMCSVYLTICPDHLPRPSAPARNGLAYFEIAYRAVRLQLVDEKLVGSGAAPHRTVVARSWRGVMRVVKYSTPACKQTFS